MQETVTESVAVGTIKLTPPGIVAVLSLGGVPLEQWVYVLTLIYLGLITIHHIATKWVIPLCAWRSKRWPPLR